MDHPLYSIGPSATLHELQEYIHKITAARGFARDDWMKVTVILAEEVGELAKALRKFTALPEGDKRQQEYAGWVQDEFADVFINLLDLANRFNVSLLHALVVKEKKHIERFGQ